MAHARPYCAPMSAASSTAKNTGSLTHEALRAASSHPRVDEGAATSPVGLSAMRAILCAMRSSGQAAALGLQRLPALEFREEQPLDLLEPLAICTDLRCALCVVVGATHAPRDGRLLLLERFDLGGK